MATHPDGVITRPVLVVGDLATDIVVRPDGPVQPATDTPARVRMSGGGAAANSAAWLARAGVPVTLIARVGDDAPGRERVAELERIGVRCHVAVDPDEPTGTVVVLIDGHGERTMLPDRGANDRLCPADIAAGFDTDAVHLHLSGYSLLHNGSRPAALAALEAARAAGLSTSVDAASAGPLTAAGAAAFLGWVRGIDLLLANADEAAVLTGSGDPAGAGDLLAAVAAAAVVKDGRRGAFWCGEGGPAHAPAVPAREVIDTTGAGDAFAAGLLAAWLRSGQHRGRAPVID